MSYQALYRVWRPRTFADVVGQSHITQTLQNAISEQKFSHAYLFSGPRGTGKTSAAKIFAQTINCEQMPTEEPCQQCNACLGILEGSISDVIEIDAASNTSVDDVREIRDKVKYASSSVPYKVYIIDEVHMISVNAFNALLKTLEEPPSHVVFILATTEPHKIPLTIISRCQRFDFKPISNQVLVDRMKTIIEKENFTVSFDALEAIALAAEGGMRDALSILDQAISYSNANVKLDDVLAVTGGISQKHLVSMINALYEKNVKEAIELFDHIIQQGKDAGRFVYDMIYFLRDILFYRATPHLGDTLERAIVDDDFIQLTEQIDDEWLQQTISELNECQQQIKWMNNPKVMIEVYLIKIANEKTKEASIQDESLINLTNQLTQLEKQFEQIKQGNNQEQVEFKEGRGRKRPKQNNYNIPYEQIRAVLTKADKQELQVIQKNWQSSLEQLKSLNPPAHAVMQDSKPRAASSDAIVTAFKYERHCSIFLEHKEVVESLLQQMLNKSVTMIPIPEENWLQLREEYIKSQGRLNENTPQKESKLVQEARKLVGDDLLEVHE